MAAQLQWAKPYFRIFRYILSVCLSSVSSDGAQPFSSTKLERIKCADEPSFKTLNHASANDIDPSKAVMWITSQHQRPQNPNTLNLRADTGTNVKAGTHTMILFSDC